MSDLAAVSALADIPCPECGHTHRMHVRGASPKYAGCMVRIDDAKRIGCRCNLTPEQIRAALTDPAR